MAGGRPSEYSEELLAKAREYRDDWKKIFPDDELPTIEGLTLHMGIARSTAYKWAEEEGKEEFSDIFDTILKEQGKTLVNKGLSGEFNSTITKVMITKHGYREGVDADLTSGGKKLDPGITNVINKIYGSDGEVHPNSAGSK